MSRRLPIPVAGFDADMGAMSSYTRLAATLRERCGGRLASVRTDVPPSASTGDAGGVVPGHGFDVEQRWQLPTGCATLLASVPGWAPTPKQELR